MRGPKSCPTINLRLSLQLLCPWFPQPLSRRPLALTCEIKRHPSKRSSKKEGRATGVIRGWEWSRWTPLAACSRVTLPRMMLRDLQLLPAIPRPAHVDAPRRGGATPVASREGGKGALLRSKLNAWTYRHSCDASQGLMMIMLDITTMSNLIVPPRSITISMTTSWRSP